MEVLLHPPTPPPSLLGGEAGSIVASWEEKMEIYTRIAAS
jgi:hypothetical protein